MKVNMNFVNRNEVNMVRLAPYTRASGGNVDRPYPEGLIARYVCYDKTNEDDDRNVLKDLSGNGHDIQLYNFAFSQGSGYGKYNVDFNTLNLNHNSYGTIVDRSYNKVSMIASRNIDTSEPPFYIRPNTTNSWKIKADKHGIIIRDFDRNVYADIDPYKIGEVKTLTQEQVNSKTPLLFYPKVPINSGDTMTLEQIPEYKGALVSDGVDDYGLCENFPILNRDRGYTVCAIRDYISTDNFVLLSNGSRWNAPDLGAFVFEEHTGSYYARSFGELKNINNTFSEKGFSFQKSNSYNGTSLSIGNNIPNPYISLYTSSYLGHSKFAKAALYSLEIYDRDLTDEEIAKVKARMIAEYKSKTGEKYPQDSYINYPGLIAAWDAKGKTNGDSDRGILKDLTGNGHDITLNGFAFNSEGSGYNNPDYPDALVFDGVDDYGINENMPILTDYTIIVKKKHINASLYAATISKFSTNDIGGNGAFLFEIPNYNGRFTTFSFGGNNLHIKIIPTISWQTKNYYNQTKINSGACQDGKNITFGRLRSNPDAHLSFVFYSAYLFDRSLDEQEIKEFIRKYIDPEYVLPSEQTI